MHDSSNSTALGLGLFFLLILVLGLVMWFSANVRATIFKWLLRLLGYPFTQKEKEFFKKPFQLTVNMSSDQFRSTFLATISQLTGSIPLLDLIFYSKSLVLEELNTGVLRLSAPSFLWGNGTWSADIHIEPLNKEQCRVSVMLLEINYENGICRNLYSLSRIYATIVALSGNPQQVSLAPPELSFKHYMKQNFEHQSSIF